MRTALGLSLLVLGVSFTVGCSGNDEPPPAPPPEWEYSPNTVQEETINSSVVKLDSGLVLVAGGRPKVPPNKWGEEEEKKSRISAIYDPQAKKGEEWRPTGELKEPRQSASAVTLSSGEVMLSGGTSSSSELLASVELYVPATETWKPISPLGQPRYGHQSTRLLSGKVLVTGGRILTETPAGKKEAHATTAELYDPATNQWSSAGDLKHFTFEATSTLLDSGEVMVLSDQGVDIYNPESNKWRQEEAPHFVARHGHTATRLDSGKILITGGGNGINLNSTALYNPSGPEPKWVQGPPLNQRNWNHQAILLPDGKVLVIGGFGGVELYTPTEPPEPQLPWIELAKDLGPYKYNKSSAILLPNNKVLLTAGTDEDIPSAIFTIPAH